MGAKSGGTQEIGKALGKLNLPDDALEDAFIRIAIQQDKLSRTEAEGVLGRLQGTPGLRSTLLSIT